MLYVGRQVVCVNARDWPARIFADYDPVLPEEGEVYEVLAIVDGRKAGWDEDGLMLVEIWNPNMDGSGERVVFRASRFAPRYPTDISVFKAMLEPAPVRVEFVGWKTVRIDA